MSKEIETNPKVLNLKFSGRVRISKYKSIFSKGITENCPRELFIIDSILKTKLWTYKIKDLNGEKIIETFYCWAFCKWVTIHNQVVILEKVKVVLDLSNYPTKRELEHAVGVDTSDLAAKKDSIALKAEVDKLDVNKLTNVLISLNNLSTEVDDLDIGKLKTVPVDSKKLSDVVDNQVVKNAKFNTLKTKVNSLENEIPDVTTLIHINQYKTDKQNLEKKIGDFDKRYQIRVV